MTRREIALQSLALCCERVGAVLEPWGFVLEVDGVHGSHHGPFAAGSFVRGETRIRIACREDLDGLSFHHAFVTEHPSYSAVESFALGYGEFMRAIGFEDECALDPELRPREGRDAIEALELDLRRLEGLLATQTEAFETAMRSGIRSYSVRD